MFEDFDQFFAADYYWDQLYHQKISPREEAGLISAKRSQTGEKQMKLSEYMLRFAMKAFNACIKKWANNMQDELNFATGSEYNPYKRSFNYRVHRAEMDRRETG